MTVPIQRPATQGGLFLWVMHRFAERFSDHAVLKGGMALRLFDCPRTTNDIDYVFVPFASKKDVVDDVKAVLAELTDANVDVRLHSKMLRARVTLDAATIQVEVNVAADCPSTPLPTGAFARENGQPSRIVRVMAPSHALAHKLAAWNERRLLRDLYDAWFLSRRLGGDVERAVLQTRLARLESRHPALGGRRRMTVDEFVSALRAELAALDAVRIDQELSPLLPPEEIVGLELRLRSGLGALADRLAPDAVD